MISERTLIETQRGQRLRTERNYLDERTQLDARAPAHAVAGEIIIDDAPRAARALPAGRAAFIHAVTRR